MVEVLDDRVPDADQTDHEQRDNEGDEAHSHRVDQSDEFQPFPVGQMQG
jgi:hypothetical protein